jgi:cytochrome P450
MGNILVKGGKIGLAVAIALTLLHKVSPAYFKQLVLMAIVHGLKIGNMPHRIKLLAKGRGKNNGQGYNLPPIVPEGFLIECLEEFGDHGSILVLQKMHARFGDIFCILTPVELHCFVADAKSVQQVMTDKDTYPGRGVKLEIRYGLLALPTNAMWSFHRKLLSKGFSEPSLKKHNEIISKDLSSLVLKLRDDAVSGRKIKVEEMTPIHVSASILGVSKEKREEIKLKKVTTEHRFGQNTVDIHELLTRVTFDIIGKVAFGYDYNTLNDNESDAFKASDILITESAMAQGEPFFVKYFNWERLSKVSWAREYISGVMEKAIGATKDLLNTDAQAKTRLLNSKNPVVEGNILQAMLMASQEENKAAATSTSKVAVPTLSEDEIMHEALTLQAAGHETTSNTTSWALLLLATYPETQKWMREECHAILTRTKTKKSNNQGGDEEDVWMYEPPNFGQWRKMERTHAVLLEALRLFPTVPAFPRRAVVDTQLMGYDIPARSHVFVYQSGLNRNAKLWGNDVQVFSPARFINAATPLSGFTHGIPSKKGQASTGQSEEEKNINAWAFMPFGAGPRSCLGRRLAIMEGVMILSSLVANYEFICPKGVSVDSIPGKTDITYGPKFGLPLIVRPAPMAPLSKI